MATHSSILAWRISGTEEPGGLPSMGLHRVGNDWSDLAAYKYIYVCIMCVCVCVYTYIYTFHATICVPAPSCLTPWTVAHQVPLSTGFSRQEFWSGLPFPSPMHEGEKWKWSSSVLSDSERPHGLQPTGLLHPRDFPGKSTGVGCHRLLQMFPWYL